MLALALAACQTPVGPVEVTRERRGQAVLAAERARDPVEIEHAELDQVRAEPAAPQDLGLERSLDLLGIQQARRDEELAEPGHAPSYYATVTSLQR